MWSIGTGLRVSVVAGGYTLKTVRLEIKCMIVIADISNDLKVLISDER